MLFNHGGRFGYPPDHGFAHHGWFFGGLVPILLFAILIGVAVWAILRLTGRPHAGVVAWPAGASGMGPFPRDPALEEVRLRYARGEMSRREFIERSEDLGGRPTGGWAEPTEPKEPQPGEPSPPEAG
jgi:uncharacterized membrane protein